MKDKLLLLLHTVSHLRLRQIVYQVLYRMHMPRYRLFPAPEGCGLKMMPPIVKQCCFEMGDDVKSIVGQNTVSDCVFTFLNLSSVFNGWNDTDKGMLWAYNLNYMDWLGQEAISVETGAEWIEKFIADLPSNRVGLDPYPIALRGLNWIKFISQKREMIDDERRKFWDDSLYSQYRLLSHKLEYHLMGNHLLEDAYSLFAAAIYFHDDNFYVTSSKLLKQQLDEQILPDGAHYEQSPMYHCILLDRLLDCVNISQSNEIFADQSELTHFMRSMAVEMLGHLDSICYDDGCFPMFNDTALGIAPSPSQLKNYASRLGLSWQPIALGASGYRHLKSDMIEAFVDVGNITATYQPGHSHADALNYELRINGKPIVVDTGISTYNKTTRRQYERSTSAHNCVVIDGKDTDEVWSGFRVGRRHNIQISNEGNCCVSAKMSLLGWKAFVERRFEVKDGRFSVEDKLTGSGNGVSYVHLASGVSPRRVHIEKGIKNVQLLNNEYSVAYNQFVKGKTLVIHFNDVLRYYIE